MLRNHDDRLPPASESPKTVHNTTVFLTTCSKNKVGLGGLPYYKLTNRKMVPDSILKARNSLYELLRQREFQKLRGAVQGPDFISDSKADGTYLPAHIRYARGQFMTSLEGELHDADTLKLWFDENRLFFLSGLYGIVSAFEPIQNYDVELTESVADYWLKNRESLTDFLVESLDQGDLLLDCCGDARYSGLIDWQKVEQNGLQVFHAIDRQREGGQVRAEAGFLAASINGENLKKIKQGENFSGVNADIKFISNNEFIRGHTSASGHLPRVGVIDTGLNELSTVAMEAARQGWNRHFIFEAILTPEALERSYRDGVKQCICLIPDRGVSVKLTASSHHSHDVT